MAGAGPNPEDAPDERLDFFSEKFDPILALNTPGVKPPVPDARVFDNLTAYEYFYSETRRLHEEKKSGGKKAEAPAAAPTKRRWLEHQMPVKTEPKACTNKNVFTRMADARGPLELLRKCRDEKRKIKILTRDDRGVRGYCVAYVVAFDKHWNVALEDVEEVWTRRKKKKVPALEDKPKKLAGSRNKVKLPKVEVTKEDAKTETCRRFVKQLLLRGENIVIVQVSPQPT